MNRMFSLREKNSISSSCQTKSKVFRGRKENQKKQRISEKSLWFTRRRSSQSANSTHWTCKKRFSESKCVKMSQVHDFTFRLYKSRLSNSTDSAIYQIWQIFCSKSKTFKILKDAWKSRSNIYFEKSQLMRDVLWYCDKKNRKSNLVFI